MKTPMSKYSLVSSCKYKQIFITMFSCIRLKSQHDDILHFQGFTIHCMSPVLSLKFRVSDREVTIFSASDMTRSLWADDLTTHLLRQFNLIMCWYKYNLSTTDYTRVCHCCMVSNTIQTFNCLSHNFVDGRKTNLNI